MIKKKNIPFRTVSFFIILLLSFVFFFTRSCNRYFDMLSSKKTNVGVANVYECKFGKGRSYLYVYKVKGAYYYSRVSSMNARFYIKKDILLQSFHVVYRSDDPSIHVLIYQRPLNLTFNLDTIVQQPKGLSKCIKCNTLGNDDGSNADRNDQEEFWKYKKSIRIWKE